MIYTFSDAVEHALDYLSGSSAAEALRDCRRSVVQAYEDLIQARTWSYLYVHGRVNTSAPYSTGTVAFDYKDGGYERELLLSDGAFPEWAGEGAHVRIGVVTYAVAEWKCATSVTLADPLAPTADVDLTRVAVTGITFSPTAADPTVVTSVAHGLATGDRVVFEGVLSTETSDPVVSTDGTFAVTVLTADTFSIDSDSSLDTAWDDPSGTWRLVPTTAYTLYRDLYPLPEDFVASDTAMAEGNFGGLSYAGPTDHLWAERFFQHSGTPRFFGVFGDPRIPGRLLLALSPYPDRAQSVDYVYHRRPRQLRRERYETGTVTAEAGSAVVTGNGTAWAADMAGMVLRIGTTRDYPTSWVGLMPPVFEARVLEVCDAQTLRLADEVPAAYAAVKYSLSDPIDLERVMMTAFLRGVEKQLSVARSTRDKPDAFAAYEQALREAMAADSRSFQGRAMGAGMAHRQPVKYMPATFR